MEQLPVSLPTDTTPRILRGDVLSVLATLPANSVHCIVTSPPYWGLRDYGTCPCSVKREIVSDFHTRPPTETDSGGGVLHNVPTASDPNCPDCHGSGRIAMETVWDEPTEPCAHQWETTFRYWDNRRASNLAAVGSDSYDSREDRRGKIASVRCERCGAWKGALGLEPSVGMYVAHLTTVGEQLRRVLRPDGTLWLNLGDCYSGSGRGPEGNLSKTRQEQGGSAAGLAGERPLGLKAKDLVGQPWRVAFAFQAAGWYLRCDVVWAKPNPMPESIRDRPARSHEYVFLMAKSDRYFYDADAVRVGLAPSSIARMEQETFWEQKGGEKDYGNGTWSPDPNGANLKSVWSIPTQAYKAAHFATFPEALVETCLKAGTSAAGACSVCGKPWRREVRAEGGTIGKSWDPAFTSGPINRHKSFDPKISDGTYRRVDLGFKPGCAHVDAPKVPCLVLDPFAGSGTTLAVARRLERRSIGIELNPVYAGLATARVGKYHDLLSWEDSK